MGTWSTEIEGNDTFVTVYDAFFDAYNGGATPLAASAAAKEQCGEEFDDEDTANDALFALAKAQWETQSLEPGILQRTRETIVGGSDLAGWESRGATGEAIEQRRKVLDAFLDTLSTPSKKKKRRRKEKWDYREKPRVHEEAPDRKKVFRVVESSVNGEYKSTSGLLMWGSSGSGIISFAREGAKIEARWLNESRLEITTEPGIEFNQCNKRCQNYRDVVVITYGTFEG